MAIRSDTLARFPGTGSGLGVFSWAREMRALALTTANPPPFPEGDWAKGDGRIALVLPGIMTGDWATTRLRTFLTRQGYRADGSEIVFNGGPTKTLVAHLERKLKSLTELQGGPIDVMGVSLGGVFARGLAHRFPEHVRQVITMCSPIQFPVTTPLEPFVRALSNFYESGWVEDRARIGARPPVPVTAVYSQVDGIVDWRQCLQVEGPGYENVHIAGPHTTMGSNPLAQRLIAERLARVPMLETVG